MTVPLNWDDVAKTEITGVVQTTKAFQGIMPVNPGGPGTIYPVLSGFVPHGAGNSYDWIAFDPRGVGGRSRPSAARSTTSTARPACVPTTKNIEGAWIAKWKARGKKVGAVLGHITTEDTVKNMDQIRVALGQEQINYLGHSYGTKPVKTYETLFPTHLRRAIFDSNTDPRRASTRRISTRKSRFRRCSGSTRAESRSTTRRTTWARRRRLSSRS